MKKKRPSLHRFSLKPKNIFNKITVLAVIVFSPVIYSNAQYQDYGNYQYFDNIDGSGMEDQQFGNINQPGKRKVESIT